VTRVICRVCGRDVVAAPDGRGGWKTKVHNARGAMSSRWCAGVYVRAHDEIQEAG
jgi:hypothetical protein